MDNPFLMFGMNKATIRTLLIVSAVLLIISLVNVIAAFVPPTEVEQETKILECEHQGEFSYRAYQKDSYLFNDILPETSPKYPIEFANRFNMTFTYRLVPDQDELVTRISEEVEVVLFKESGQTEEVVLVPSTLQTGTSTVSFSLDASELATGPTTTITANVYATVETDNGPIFESFTQSLTIESEGPFLEVAGNLSSTQQSFIGELSFRQIGEFDYSVLLKSDSPWGAITIGPPSLSSAILGPGETIFLNLLDRIDVTFNYRLASDRPLNQVASDVEITAVLEGTGLWSKIIPLVSAERSGNFEISFTLDLFHYLELLEIIRAETAATAESYGLTITADVHTVAETDYGQIDEVFSQTLSTVLGGGTLEWSEELVQTQPGSIQKTELLPNTDTYMGLSLAVARNISVAVTSILFLFLVFSVVLYIRFKPPELTAIEREVLRVLKRYGNLMVEATVDTPMKGDEIISLDSMEDLIKVADELGKPVIHMSPSTSEEPHAYYILDAATRYQYLLATGNVE